VCKFGSTFFGAARRSRCRLLEPSIKMRSGRPLCFSYDICLIVKTIWSGSRIIRPVPRPQQLAVYFALESWLFAPTSLFVLSERAGVESV
jgi:hypothetical protein